MSIIKKIKKTITGVIHPDGSVTSKDSSASSAGGGQVTSTTSTSSFNAKEFIESGGTKTDPGTAIERFRKEAGITPGSKSGAGSGGGGSYNPDTGVYINPQGQGFSMAVPPAGAAIVQSPSSRPGLTSSQLSAAREGFSGRVEVFDKGIKEEERYYVKGQDVGTIIYDKKKRYVQRPVPSRLTFKTPEKEEQITFTREGAEFQESTFTALLPGDVGEVLIPAGNEVNYNLDFAARDIQGTPYYAKGTVNDLLYLKSGEDPTKFQKFLAQSLKEASLPEDTKGFKQLYKSGDLPAIVRKSFTETFGKGIGYVTSKITGQKQSPQLNKMIGETFLFAGLSSIPTTAQIYKATNVKSSLSFLGASQRVNNKIVNTDLVFNVKTGSQLQKGIATGTSGVIAVSGEKSAVVTIGGGGFIKRSVEFPTGRILTRFSKPFEGVELGLTKNLNEEVTAQIGVGRINTQASKLSEFASASLSKRKGDYSFSIGGIVNKGGQTDFAGVIKDVTPSEGFVSYSTGKSFTQSKIVNKQALTSLKSIVSASVKPPVNIPTPFVKAPVSTIVSAAKQTSLIISIPKQTSQEVFKPVSLYSGTGLYERTEGGQLPKSAFNVKTNFMTGLTPLFSQKSLLGLYNLQLQSQNQATKQRTKNDTSFAQGQIPISTQASKLGLRQLQLQQQKIWLVQKQQQRQFSRFFPKFPRARTTRSFIPFNLKPFKQPKVSGGRYSVSVRRKGKFIPVGAGLSFEKAFSLGKQTTQYGLGQTFKVRNMFGGTPRQATPKGYYPKYSKKEGLVFIEQPKTKINTKQEKNLLAGLSMFGKRKKNSISKPITLKDLNSYKSIKLKKKVKGGKL